MKIRILPLKIVESIQTEDSLLDQSIIESIYEIRALKVAIELANKDVEVTKTNTVGQVFIDSHDIWLRPDTFVELPNESPICADKLIKAFRQATPTDIKESQIVYIDGDDGFVKMTIEEVIKPSSLYKAFCADDGSRYGLDGCFIFELKEGDPAIYFDNRLVTLVEFDDICNVWVDEKDKERHSVNLQHLSFCQ